MTKTISEMRMELDMKRDAELDAAGVTLPPFPQVPEGWELDCTQQEARRYGHWVIRKVGEKGSYSKKRIGETEFRSNAGWTRKSFVDAWGNVRESYSVDSYAPDRFPILAGEWTMENPPPSYADCVMTKLPKRFATKPWSKFDDQGDRAKIKYVCKAWVSSVYSDQSNSLWLTGQPGRGKTQIAYWMVLELAENEIPCEVHCLPDLVSELRGTYSAGNRDRQDFERLLRRLETCKALFLDDVGAEGFSGKDKGDDIRQMVFRIVNARWENELPTLVTSNATPEQLGAMGMDGRIVSRFSSYFSVHVNGPDFRGAR